MGRRPQRSSKGPKRAPRARASVLHAVLRECICMRGQGPPPAAAGAGTIKGQRAETGHRPALARTRPKWPCTAGPSIPSCLEPVSLGAHRPEHPWQRSVAVAPQPQHRPHVLNRGQRVQKRLAVGGVRGVVVSAAVGVGSGETVAVVEVALACVSLACVSSANVNPRTPTYQKAEQLVVIGVVAEVGLDGHAVVGARARVRARRVVDDQRPFLGESRDPGQGQETAREAASAAAAAAATYRIMVTRR